ncbi:MAG: hypothetical protein K9N49_04290 [Candidatus Marinimicrobia bacterium]|nr:hypothetical protein [Candidatus Neomarinimicrobiota bacterium]
MTEQTPFESGGAGDPLRETRAAIPIFEGILEAMPQDVGALDALINMYEIIGDQDKAWHYLERLTRTFLEQHALTEAAALAPKLAAFATEHPEAVALLEAVAITPSETAPPPEPAPLAAPAEVKTPARGAAVKREVALAWKLQEAGLLNEEEYAAVVHDLTEISLRDTKLTVSALHVLHDRSFRGLEKALAHLAKLSGHPYVDVGYFDSPPATLERLPIAAATTLGALVFETLGDELLVAVLNPLDAEVQEQVHQLTGCACHFYLTSPEAFERAMKKRVA